MNTTRSPKNSLTRSESEKTKKGKKETKGIHKTGKVKKIQGRFDPEKREERSLVRVEERGKASPPVKIGKGLVELYGQIREARQRKTRRGDDPAEGVCCGGYGRIRLTGIVNLDHLRRGTP